MKKIMPGFAAIALALSGCVEDISEALLAARSVGPETALSEMTPEEVKESNEYSFERTQAMADSVFDAWKQDPALSLLLPENGNIDSIELEPTDWYIRFLATDEDSYSALQEQADTLDFELFDFPVHLNLSDTDREVYASDTSDGGLWFYATLPYDFDFSEIENRGIRYEKLDEVYIHRLKESDPKSYDANGDLIIPNEEFWDAVTDASIGINDDPKTRANKKWYPRAIIKLLNDHPMVGRLPNDTIDTQRYHPLEGVKVRVWEGVNWAKVFTDKNGDTGKIRRNSGLQFKKAVNYEIIWETNRWNIRYGENALSLPKQARTDGPCIRDTWHRTFATRDIDKKSMLHECFAAVHKALHNYVYIQRNWYLNDENLPNLTKDNITVSKIGKFNTMIYDELAEKHGEKAGTRGKYLPDERDSEFATKIEIYTKYTLLKGAGPQLRPIHKIERDMYHELGHASDHWAHSDFLKKDKYVLEGYACFISALFMYSLYPGHLEDYWGEVDWVPEYSGIGEWLWRHGFTIKEVLNDILNQRTIKESEARALALNNGRVDPEMLSLIFKERWHNWRYPQSDDKQVVAITSKNPSLYRIEQVYDVEEKYLSEFVPLRNKGSETDPIYTFLDSIAFISNPYYDMGSKLWYGRDPWQYVMPGELPMPVSQYTEHYRWALFEEPGGECGYVDDGSFYDVYKRDEWVHLFFKQPGNYKLTRRFYKGWDNLKECTLDFHIKALECKPVISASSDAMIIRSGDMVAVTTDGFEFRVTNDNFPDGFIDRYEWRQNGTIVNSSQVSGPNGTIFKTYAKNISLDQVAKNIIECRAVNYFGQESEWSEPFEINVIAKKYDAPIIYVSSYGSSSDRNTGEILTHVAILHVANVIPTGSDDPFWKTAMYQWWYNGYARALSGGAFNGDNVEINVDVTSPSFVYKVRCRIVGKERLPSWDPPEEGSFAGYAPLSDFSNELIVTHPIKKY